MRPNRDETETSQVKPTVSQGHVGNQDLIAQEISKENDAFLRRGSFRGLALLSIF